MAKEIKIKEIPKCPTCGCEVKKVGDYCNETCEARNVGGK